MEYILAAHDFGLSTMAILETIQQFGYSTMSIEVVEECINSYRENPRREYFEPDYAFRLIDHVRSNEEMDPEHLYHLLLNRGFPVASAEEVAGAAEILEYISESLKTADKDTAEWRKAVLALYKFGFTVFEVYLRCGETKTLRQVYKVICEGLPSLESMRTGRAWDEEARKFFLASYHLGMGFDDILFDLNVHGFDQGEYNIIFLHEIMKAECLIDEYRVVRDGTILTWASPDDENLPVRAIEEREDEEFWEGNWPQDGEGEDRRWKRGRNYSI